MIIARDLYEQMDDNGSAAGSSFADAAALAPSLPFHSPFRPVIPLRRSGPPPVKGYVDVRRRSHFRRIFAARRHLSQVPSRVKRDFTWPNYAEINFNRNVCFARARK